MLPVHITLLYFCLAPRGLAGKGSQTDLHQELSPLCPRRRGGCHHLLFSPGEAGEHQRARGMRGAPPPARPRTPAARSRIAPGRHGTYPGVRDARQRGWPRPRRTGRGGGRRRVPPFPRLLTAAGQRPEPARLGTEATSPVALPRPAQPGPARPVPRYGAGPGGGGAGGSRDVPAPRSIFSAAIGFHS